MNNINGRSWKNMFFSDRVGCAQTEKQTEVLSGGDAANPNVHYYLRDVMSHIIPGWVRRNFIKPAEREPQPLEICNCWLHFSSFVKQFPGLRHKDLRANPPRTSTGETEGFHEIRCTGRTKWLAKKLDSVEVACGSSKTVGSPHFLMIFSLTGSFLKHLKAFD